MARNNFISIPKPCSQDWQQMSVTEKGRFCTSCQKNILDFTHLSDRQIENILNSNKSVCGRFNSSQLDRELMIPKEKSSFWIAAATGIMSFLDLGNTESLAQEAVKVEQTDTKEQDKKDTTHKDKVSVEVTGTVYEDSKLPLPGASVHIKNTSIGTQTDFDGKYKITAKEGDVLVYTYVGFTTEEAVVTSTTKTIMTTLKSDSEVIEIIVGGAIYQKKRTLFGRVFHSIGSIFK